MLKVAIPNKGILSESAISMLKEAGYATRRDPQELHVVDEANQIEFFYLRPRDIATYVGSGSLDAGLTVLHVGHPAEHRLDLTGLSIRLDFVANRLKAGKL